MQTYPDWEAVFVNDGSKDGSGDALDRLSMRDSRVTVIHKPNEGVAVAREAGIKAADGDPIYIPDFDG